MSNQQIDLSITHESFLILQLLGQRSDLSTEEFIEHDHFPWFVLTAIS